MDRVKLGAEQSLIRKRDMMIDILPHVYNMLHPNVREINIQLFDEFEKQIFLKAIELMVVFDIKLIPRDEKDDVTTHRLPTT